MSLTPATTRARRRLLTVSVDDGHPADTRTAELLGKHGLKATFYVLGSNPERAVLHGDDLRSLATDFEIGAHTFCHRPLTRLDDEEAYSEILNGKQWLEDLLGVSPTSFCYPMGKFTRATVRLVRDAGFIGARTCMFNVTSFPSDPYRVGVSTHAYSHRPDVQLRHALLQGNFRGVRDFVRVHRLARGWAVHFAAALDWVNLHGGVAHLYLHSWEIDENDDWRTLDAVLEHAAGFDHFERVTNGELFQLCRRAPDGPSVTTPANEDRGEWARVS